MRKIFDIHTHIYPEKIAAKASRNLGAFYEFTVQGEGTYAALESSSAPCGVRGFLLLGVATNPTQVESVNNFIAETVKTSRSRGFFTYGFLGMHQDFHDFAAELDRCTALGLSGVKLHPDIQRVDIDDRRLFELYSAIEGRLPLYLHMGDDRPQYQYSSPDKLAHILDEFPRLTVVAAHLGGYKAWDAAVPLLEHRENVYFDTSSALWAMSTERANEIISHLGTERVMFGTDYPVKNTDEEVQRVLALRLTDDELEDIFWNNAARFLHIDA